MMFKTKIFLRSFLAVLGSTLIGMMLASTAGAANPEPVVVQVEFVAPIQINENNPLQFGLLDLNLAAAELIIIAPDSSVTDVSLRVVGGTQLAASLDIIAAPTRAITILVDNFTNNTGYTLGSPVCNYDTGVDGACGGAGLGETSVAGPTLLLVGLTLTGTGGAGAGVFNGAFDVTITYN